MRMGRIVGGVVIDNRLSLQKSISVKSGGKEKEVSLMSLDGNWVVE